MGPQTVNVVLNRDVPVESHQVQQVHVNTQSSVSQTHQRPHAQENRQIVTGTATVNHTVPVTSSRVIGGGISGGAIIGGGSHVVGGGIGSTVVGGGIGGTI